ncbi:hypothetical protein MTBSS4_110003 [Magnetospirillum sp. SS-4]|nr:hypothetical protein MTBSS4_110003 [Magnetospirillum sp. SS-4]
MCEIILRFIRNNCSLITPSLFV